MSAAILAWLYISIAIALGSVAVCWHTHKPLISPPKMCQHEHKIPVTLSNGDTCSWFCPECKQTIYAIQYYSYDPDSPNTNSTVTENTKRKAKRHVRSIF